MFGCGNGVRVPFQLLLTLPALAANYGRRAVSAGVGNRLSKPSPDERRRLGPPSPDRFIPRPALILFVGILAAAFLACGGDGGGAVENRILTVVRVEERDANGDWVPVENARVLYEIYSPRGSTPAEPPPLFYQYEGTTNSQGISTIGNDPEGRVGTDIGMVVVDVIHPDGRTSFKRKKVEEKFDFAEWSKGFMTESAPPGEIAAAICADAVDFETCENSLANNDLKMWGAGVVVRVR